MHYRPNPNPHEFVVHRHVQRRLDLEQPLGDRQVTLTARLTRRILGVKGRVYVGVDLIHPLRHMQVPIIASRLKGFLGVDRHAYVKRVRCQQDLCVRESPISAMSKKHAMLTYSKQRRVDGLISLETNRNSPEAGELDWSVSSGACHSSSNDRIFSTDNLDNSFKVKDI